MTREVITNQIYLSNIAKSTLCTMASASLKTALTKIDEMDIRQRSFKKLEKTMLKMGWKHSVISCSLIDADRAACVFHGFPAYYKCVVYALLTNGWTYNKQSINKE